MRLVSTFSCSRISRQASAIDSATPLGLEAPGLMITSASRKRLPWGRFVSDMSDVSVKERDAPNGGSPTHCCTSSWLTFWVWLMSKRPVKLLLFGSFRIRNIYSSSYLVFQVCTREKTVHHNNTRCPLNKA